MNDFTPTSSDPVARARALGAAIEAAADAIERSQRIPEPLLSQMHAARICRMLLPRSVDGDEVRTVGLLAGDRGTQPPRRLGRLECVRRQQRRADRTLPAAEVDARDLRRPACRGRLGTAERVEGASQCPGGYRITGSMELRLRLPPGNLDGRAWPRGGARRFVAAERGRQANGAHAAVPRGAGDADRRFVARDRHARYDVGCLSARRCVRARGHSAARARIRRCGANLAGFTPSRCRVSMRSAWPVSPWASRAPCSTRSRNSRPARRRAISGGSRTTRSCSRTWRRWRRGSVPLAPIWWRRCPSIWSADDSWVIDVPARARVRLACAFAIQTAEAVADYAYKSAGVDAIFLGTAVRAALPRHPHAIAADPVAHRALRVGRPDHARDRTARDILLARLARHLEEKNLFRPGLLRNHEKISSYSACVSRGPCARQR